MLPLHLSQSDRRHLSQVALGQEPADTVIVNGRLVNVFTGEILSAQSVAIAGGRIARVDADCSETVGPKTTVIDAEGLTLAPGMMDTHCHPLATRYNLPEFLRYAIPGGTTMIVTETIELGSIFGIDGVRAALDALAGQPIKILATVPPLAAVSPFIEEIAPTIEEYRDLLARPEVVGLGETYWGNLQRDDGRLHALIEEVLQHGKLAEGHSAGARGAKLQAYVCEGISSCHEPITAEEGLQRLRLGLHFMIREGEIRQDLEAIAPLWKQPIDPRRMIMVTDSVGPERLLDRGYLEHNLQRAIALGLDPVKALQMVTINPAEHFRLDAHVGSIAPGRCADIMALPGVRTIRPRWVMSDGMVIARDGALLVEPRAPAFPDTMLRSLKLGRTCTARDFEVPLEDGRVRQAHAIEYVTGLVTRESVVSVRGHQGRAIAAEMDLCIAASLDRSRGTAEHFVGWVRGYGLRKGAIASSWSWDSGSVIVLGADSTSIATAVNRLQELGGGAVIADGQSILAEVPAPIAGIMSAEPLPTLVTQLRHLKTTLRELGCPWPDPLLAVDVLSTAAIPHFRITDRGYARVRDGSGAGLWAN